MPFVRYTMAAFPCDHVRYSVPDEEFAETPPVADENRVTILECYFPSLKLFRYLYDFGAHLAHTGIP